MPANSIPGLRHSAHHAIVAFPFSRPSCSDPREPILAWYGTPPPGWRPGLTMPCIACGAGCGEPHRDPPAAGSYLALMGDATLPRAT